MIILKKVYNNKYQWVSLGLLLLVTVLAFSPSLKRESIPFPGDDLLGNNQSTLSAFQETFKGFFTTVSSQGYAPLARLAQALEFAWGGSDPFFTHLTNLVLHCFIVIAIYFLALRLQLTPFGAVMAALLFGVHPMHAQHVSEIFRGDLLASFFYVLSMLFYCDYLKAYKIYLEQQEKTSKRGKPVKLKKGLLVISFGFGLLSALSHSVGISLIFVWIVLDWFFDREINVKSVGEKSLMLILFAVLACVNFFAMHAKGQGAGIGHDLFLLPWTSVFYLRQFFFPVINAPFYPLPPSLSAISGQYIISVLLLALIVFTVIRFKAKKWFVFSSAFFVLSSLAFIQLTSGASNYLNMDVFYLPTLGFCLWFGLCLEKILNANGQRNELSKQRPFVTVFRYFAIAVLFLAVMSLIYVSHERSKIWKDKLSLWKAQLRMYPNDIYAINRLATVLRQEQEYQKAETLLRGKIMAQGVGVVTDSMDSSVESDVLKKISQVIYLYKKAIKIDEDDLEAHCGLADVYQRLGLSSQAIKMYEQAIAKNSHYAVAYQGLAGLYLQKKQASQAVGVMNAFIQADFANEDLYYQALIFYSQALRLYPENILYKKERMRIFGQYIKMTNQKKLSAEDYFRLGFLFHQMGDFERSSSAYLKVLDKNPRQSQALFYLGNLYRDFGFFDKALDLYEKAIALSPKNANIYKNLGLIYGIQKQYDKAIEYYEKAIEINEKDGNVYFELAHLYEVKGNLRKAINDFEKASEFLPADERIYYNLGNIYAKLEVRDKAADCFKKAISLNPRFVDAYVNLSIVLFQSQDYQEAIKYCDYAVILGYEPPEVYRKLLESKRKKE